MRSIVAASNGHAPVISGGHRSDLHFDAAEECLLVFHFGELGPGQTVHDLPRIYQIAPRPIDWRPKLERLLDAKRHRPPPQWPRTDTLACAPRGEKLPRTYVDKGSFMRARPEGLEPPTF